MSEFYTDYSFTDFDEMLNKKEFIPLKKKYQYQEPNQMLLRNWISKPTIYENILLFNQLGTGKTCTSIMIAEGFREYIHNMNNKIVVLVKNKNIERNFLNELLSKCTDNTYLSDEERKLYFAPNITLDVANQIKKKELVHKLHRTINKQYVFYKYQSFVNRVLGPKIKGTNTRKSPSEPIENLNNTVIIVDEAHNIANNDIYLALKSILSKSYNYRLVLLTATPLRDNPKDIFELSNLLNINSPQLQLPIRDTLIKEKTLVERKQSEYINQNIFKEGIIYITENGKEHLQDSMQGKVSFLMANTTTNPISNYIGEQLIKNRTGTTNVVYCYMSDYQYHVYKKAMQIDTNTKIADTNIKEFNLIDSIDAIEAEEDILDNIEQNRKSSAVYKNVRDASTMVYPEDLFGKDGFLKVFKKSSGKYQLLDQYSKILNEQLNYFSSKLYNLLQNVNKSPGSVFIFSNYVSWGGTSLIKQLLLYNGYFEYNPKIKQEYKSFIVFDDNTKPELREKYRRIFNSPENKNGAIIKILIGSPIISEGITLKNVRQVHIMEPSWNMSRINQIIGRAVRNYSHHDLDSKDRTVDIYKYVSVYANPAPTDFFIDKEMYILAEEKDRSNKIVERLLKQISFDCTPLKKRNRLPPNVQDGDAICDYQKCDYQCKIESKSEKIYRNTYNLYLSQFDHHDIMYVLNAIRHLFKTYFIWSLEDIVIQIKQREPNIANEVIYTVLDTIVTKKVEFNDVYDREGYIINNGPYYIFNSSNIDINSSFYSKIMDFSSYKNKFTFNEFANNTFGETAGTKKSKKDIEKEQPKVTLSEQDVLYNKEITDNNLIYGSYVSKTGVFDNLFRIIDRSGETKSTDKRKIPSGMAITSYTKNKLEELVKKLNIDIKLYVPMATSTSNLDNTTLQNVIEQHFLDKKIMLKPHRN